MSSSNRQHHPTRAGPAASAEPLRGPPPPLDFASGTMRDLSSAPWAVVLGAVATPQGRCCSKCRAGVPQGAGEHELPGRSRKVRSQFPAFHSDFLQLRWLRVSLLIVKKYRGSLARNREQGTLPSSKNSPKHSQTCRASSPAGCSSAGLRLASLRRGPSAMELLHPGRPLPWLSQAVLLRSPLLAGGWSLPGAVLGGRAKPGGPFQHAPKSRARLI